MKQYIIIISLFFLFGCVDQQTTATSLFLSQKCDSLITVNEQLNTRISLLTDSLILLRYPASDRLIKIKKLISEDKLDDATAEISALKFLFPQSKEIDECKKQEAIITNIIVKKKAEEDRIKALGYKAFHDKPTANIGTKKFTITGFNFGRTFTFGYCSDVGEYSYRTADKDNTYVLASMSLSSNDKGYVSTPSLYIYEIDGGELKRIRWFSSEYSAWESYGAKIGNYSDDTHDFSKVNTVRYNLAAEISKDYMNKPLVILTSIDDKTLEDTLTIEDVKNKCVVIKILNRNKL